MTAMLSRRSGGTVTDDGVDRFLALSAVQARITRTRHVVWNHTRSLAIATVQRASFRGGNLNPHRVRVSVELDDLYFDLDLDLDPYRDADPDSRMWIRI